MRLLDAAGPAHYRRHTAFLKQSSFGAEGHLAGGVLPGQRFGELHDFRVFVGG